MSRAILTNLNLSQNQILNVALQNLGSAPTAPVPGQIFFNTTTNRPFVWNAAGNAWQWRATDTDQFNGQSPSYYLNAANFSGLSASATTDTTNAANITSGTLPLARLPAIPVADVTGAEQTANKGVASGYAGLDSTGKVPTTQLPAAVLGGLNYQGTWNAATNTPALVSSTGTKGYYYKVATAGATSIDGLAVWNLGDSIVFDGATWDKIDGTTNEVISVAGRSGVITLAAADVSGLATSATTDTTNASNIASGTLAAARLPTAVVQKFAAAVGDGISTSIIVTHALNTQDVTVGLYQSATPFSEVEADIAHTTVNTITLAFATAPTANQYRVVVHG